MIKTTSISVFYGSYQSLVSGGQKVHLVYIDEGFESYQNQPTRLCAIKFSYDKRRFVQNINHHFSLRCYLA